MMAITAFGISLTVLILFLAFKLFESTHPMKLYSDLCGKGDAVVISLGKYLRTKSVHVEEHLSAKNVLHVFTRHTAAVVAKTAREVEIRAQNITRKMARNKNSQGRTTNSKFLEEVTTHKRSLDTEQVRRETSLEE